jgi:hypothetical protein
MMAMAIEDDIMALLHSPEVQKIGFVAEAVRIGGDRYEAVAKKLKEGLVTVDIEPDLDDAQPRLSHYEAEGIAYIAAALYIWFAGGPTVDDTEDPHVQVADAIARNVIAAGHTLYVATPSEMRKLRRAIGKDPLYAPMRITRSSATASDHRSFAHARFRLRRWDCTS